MTLSHSVQESSLAGVKPFELTALRHPTVSTLLYSHHPLLTELLDGLGSPLHVVLPEVFEENIAALRQAFAETGADVDILFAKKANKADCFVRSASATGLGVDTASTAEVVKALAGGVPGHRIGISGPEKDDTLHTLAVQHDCLVAVDSITELRRLAATARLARRQVRVLLRARTSSQPGSRFGMAGPERVAAVDQCTELGEHVNLHGFSFHLNGYSPEERAVAANEMIEHCLDARQRGAQHADVVDIGGGLPMRYVDPQLWEQFVRQNEPAHYHGTKASRGLYFYPYGGMPPTEAARRIMTHPVDGIENLSAKATRTGIRFIVEPGRSLLDQAGFTVFRVQQVEDRRDTDGYAIATVAGNSLSLCEQWFNTDYLPDPVLLSAQPVADEEFPASVAGSTCLENDMVTWRKIGLPRPVRPGDHLVYLNTAGYHSDFLESRFHDTALPWKVVVRFGDGAPRWRLDGI